MASSIYDWKDRNDPQNEFDGLFRFLTFNDSLSDSSMGGEAFLVLHEDIKQVDDFDSKVLKPMQSLQKKVENYQNALRANQYSPRIELELKEVQEDVDKIKVAIKHIANNELRQRVFNIKYRILSNGLTFLKTEDWLGKSNNPEHRDAINRTKFIADKQCFIYLKYSLHRHKHHNGQEDRLTSVHKIDHGNYKRGALKLVEDLNRSIIEIKEREVENFDSPDHYLQGFISYAKSLLISLEATKLIEKEEALRKRDYLDNIFWSWKAVASRTQKVRSEKKDTRDSNSKGIVEFFQAISILVATFSLIIHVSFNVLREPNSSFMLKGTIYQDLPLYFKSTVVLDVLTFLFTLVVFMVAGWIIWQPHGLVRRPIGWFVHNFGIIYVNVLRALLVAVAVLCIGLTI